MVSVLPRRTIIGLCEDVIIFGNKVAPKKVRAKIDTGASRSSIDRQLAQELKYGPFTRVKVIKSAHGTSLRAVQEGLIELASKRIPVGFTVANRSHMKYQVLIGQDVLKQGKFLIDPLKS
ncbi:ATP-dependent zinc protease [Candidatus Woesearchaeota archaeon]|nr:ATP-dependent zinc protease [Candidatus Woesearchaeota archaeon]